MSIFKTIVRGVAAYYTGGASEAYFQGQDAKKAAEAAQAGNQAGINTQRSSLSEAARMYDTGREDLAPYREAGEYGLGQYTDALKRDDLPEWGGFGSKEFEQFKDPGYEFRLEAGMEGLDRMFASRGQRFSGNRGIGLQKYGQEMASQEFGAARGRAIDDYRMKRGEGLNRLSQWANLAQSGQQAAGASSSLGANYAAQVAGINKGISGMQQYGGQVDAAGIIGKSNAISSGLAAYNYNQGLNTGGGSGGSGAQVSGDAYAPAYWR